MPKEIRIIAVVVDTSSPAVSDGRGACGGRTQSFGDNAESVSKRGLSGLLLYRALAPKLAAALCLSKERRTSHLAQPYRVRLPSFRRYP